VKILQITGRSLDSQTIQHDENSSLLTKIRTSSETTKDNFHVATLCAWIQIGVPIRPPQFPIILPSCLNSYHLSMVFPMFTQRFPHVFPQFHPASGVSEGYPYYSNGDMLIRYHHEGRKGLVAGSEHKGNNCIAYAEAQETMHPGYGFLRPGRMRFWGYS
jgi:hypothetical protein